MKIASTTRKSFCIVGFLHIPEACVYNAWIIRLDLAAQCALDAPQRIVELFQVGTPPLTPPLSAPAGVSTSHGATTPQKASLLFGFVRKKRAFYVAVAEVREGESYRQDSEGVAAEGDPYCPWTLVYQPIPNSRRIMWDGHYHEHRIM